MNSRLMTMGSVFLYVLSVGIGLTWWFLAWRSGVFANLPPPGPTVVLGFGVVQVLASVIVLFVLLQTLRGSAHAADALTFGLNAAHLFANIVWCLTPILGGPLLLLVLLLALLRLYLTKRGASAVSH